MKLLSKDLFNASTTAIVFWSTSSLKMPAGVSIHVSNYGCILNSTAGLLHTNSYIDYQSLIKISTERKVTFESSQVGDPWAGDRPAAEQPNGLAPAQPSPASSKVAADVCMYVF